MPENSATRAGECASEGCNKSDIPEQMNERMGRVSKRQTLAPPRKLKVANSKCAPPARPPFADMSAVLSAVGCGGVGGGSLELQLENEQKWLIYGPATRTHEGRRTNRTNNKYIARRTHPLLT